MDRQLDGMLELVIETCLERGQPDAELPLVLHIGGLVVSGTAISTSAYFERAGAEFRASGHDLTPVFEELAGLDRAREAEKERLELLLDRATAGGRELSDQEREQFARDFEGSETGFLHLKDVQLYGTGPAPLRLALWRARVADISGWTLQESAE